MGGFANLPTETKAALQEIARLSYGSLAVEGTKGGGGRMCALVHGGRVRVIKFNTHSSERAWKFGKNKATAEMKRNSDRLRGILLSIAKASGCTPAKMREIRSKLGLKDRQDANMTLLDRKAVAKVVGMIGGTAVWEEAWKGRKKADYASQKDMSYAHLVSPGTRLGHKSLGMYQDRLRAYTADEFKTLVDQLAVNYARTRASGKVNAFKNACSRVFTDEFCRRLANSSLCAVNEKALGRRITQSFDLICRLALPAEGDEPVVTAALKKDCRSLIASGADSLLKTKYNVGKDLTVADLESYGMTFEDLESVEAEHPGIRDLLATPEGRKLFKAALESSAAVDPYRKQAEAVRICRDLASLVELASANVAANAGGRAAVIAEFAAHWAGGISSLPAGTRLCDVIHWRAEDGRAFVGKLNSSSDAERYAARMFFDMVFRLPLNCLMKPKAFQQAYESILDKFAQIGELARKCGGKNDKNHWTTAVTLVKNLLARGEQISRLPGVFGAGEGSASRQTFTVALLDSFLRTNPFVRTSIDLLMRSNKWQAVVDGQARQPGHDALVVWSRKRAKEVSGHSLLKILEEGGRYWQFGPLEAMFKDKESRDIANEILGILDIGTTNILDNVFFLSMLPGAVEDLRTNGFSRPLTRERLSIAFSLQYLPGGRKCAAMDDGAFTKVFVSALQKRADNDRQNVFNELRGLYPGKDPDAVQSIAIFLHYLVGNGVRYESALAMLLDPTRGLKREDVFIVPKPFGPHELEGGDDIGQFLEKCKDAFIRDGIRSRNVVFSVGDEPLFKRGSEANEVFGPNMSQLNTQASPDAKKQFVNNVVSRIRTLIPGMTDLQLARVLSFMDQVISFALRLLDPMCNGSDNFNIKCTPGANGAVHVKITPRSEGAGSTPVGNFLLELDVGRNGVVKVTHLKSRDEEWDLQG